MPSRPPLPNHFSTAIVGNERRAIELFTQTNLSMAEILDALSAYRRDTASLREWLYDELGPEAVERREQIVRSIRMMRKFGWDVTLCGECGHFKPGKRDRETLVLKGVCKRGGFEVDRCMECVYEKGLL